MLFFGPTFRHLLFVFLVITAYLTVTDNGTFGLGLHYEIDILIPINKSRDC